MEDRRVFERIDTRLSLRFLDPNSGREGNAETTDISADGLGFVTNEGLYAKAPLEMWLILPDKHEPIYTRGEVVWAESLPDTRQYRIGVHLEKANLMGLARVLWVKRKGS